MAVEKRGRAWGVRLKIGGQAIRRSLGVGSTKADAQALEGQIRRDAIAGRLGRAPERSINDAFTRWLEGESLTHKDRRGDKDRIKHWRTFTDGHALRDAVSVAAKATDAWHAAGLAPATINRRLACLRRVVHLAHSRWGWLDDDLSRKLPALKDEGKREVYPTREQVMALVHNANAALGDAILLAAYTGLRQSELLRLQPSDVDGDCIIVRVSKSGKSRTVPVPKIALPILKRLPLPFKNVEQLRWDFRDARKAAGLPDIRFHDLRHAYGSWLAQSGASATVIRDVMGHSNLSVTSRYLHTVPEHVRKAVRRLK